MPKTLAIVGLGKMGRLIEELAPEAGFSVGLKLDIDSNAGQMGITPENFKGVDVAIEFSTPAVAVETVSRGLVPHERGDLRLGSCVGDRRSGSWGHG